MYVINFIQARNIEVAKNRWENIANYFIQYPGIQWINLYKVVGIVKAENPVSYQLVSIIKCKDQLSYESAKSPIFSSKENGDFSTIRMGKETFCETYYASAKEVQWDTQKTLLINPFKIKQDQMKLWFHLWREASQKVESKPGFIAVNFLITMQPDDSEVKFINIAEWENEDYIKAVVDHKNYAQHRKEAKAYPMEPSLCKYVVSIHSQLQWEK